MARGGSSDTHPGQGWLLLLLLLAPALTSAARDDVYVPEALRPWVDWVLQDKEYRSCPFFFGQGQAADTFVCTWPGQLDLDVTANGARFSQPWTIHAHEQWVPLPGEGNVWPEQVTANGQAVAVVLNGNVPSVRLAPGEYTLAGRFAWSEAPRTLNVPAETALLSLTIGGNRVSRPERSRNSVWLAERETEMRPQDSLDVQVYRLVADDVPTVLTSHLEFNVSGNAREVVVGPVLPRGFVPLSLDSPLPARLESGGRLRLQVRPGNWQVRLAARGDRVLDEVTLPEGATGMPDAEIWSYRSNDRLRVTMPEGPAPVDPGQVSTPDEWLELPAFRIQPGDTLTIVEQSRGMPASDNRLHLDRHLWMDFEGDGFVFADSITGTMRSDWRLDVVEPYVLLSASEDGQNLLVTVGPEDGMTGVELRQRDVGLQAIGRSDTRGTLPATGWQTRFDSAGATLNLPPGNKLFAAPGADGAPGSWIERWELLDFFLVLVVTIATARLFGWQGGALALLALTLSWHENGAPQWIWLNLLAAIALARAAPEGRPGRMARGYRAVSFAVLVIVLVPFAAGELRIGIYPQLEPQRGIASRPPVSQDAMGVSPAAPLSRERREPALKAEVEEVIVTGMSTSRSYARYAPNAIVQAGPGKPSWRWNTYRIDWSGPVDAQSTVKLMIMPRWLVSGLRFASVLLLLALAALLAFETFSRRANFPWSARANASGPALSVGLVLLAAGTLAGGGEAHAQTPSPELLQQLEQRLLEPPECVPRCAEIAAAHVEADAGAMSIQLEVHALENVAVPLPGSLQGWRPEAVQVDGVSARVYRRADQTLWIRAAGGRHRVTLKGPLPPVDSLEIPFPAVPRIITANAADWTLSGIRDRRLVTGSLQLARLRTGGEGDSSRFESDRFPVFARVERMVELDLDWRVTTVVVRVAPEQGAFTLDVPLLEGEAIVSGDLQLRDGNVVVSMGQGQRVVRWESTLPRTSPLELATGQGTPWKEVWRFGVSSIWHVSFDGVPESEPESSVSGARVLEFYPRPGETLTVEMERPAASGGTSLAFDSVSLGSESGARSRSVALDLAYRSTRGAQHNIRLPDEAEVRSVTVDGRGESLRPRNGVLSLPILPGEHRIEVRWREEVTPGFRSTAPAVDLAAPASNIRLGMELPRNRWILATAGPRLGPAVMYWSELAALVLAAVILGCTGLTPLSTRHWLFLGIGFSTFSWPALALVASWLLVMGTRERWARDLSWWRFDLLQLSLAALSVAALAAILVTVPSGLLGTPDMHVAGNNSFGNSLNWFADRSEGTLPPATVFSLPLWAYKLLILAWALWLSFALLRWLPWAWSSFTSQGLWRSRGRRGTAEAGGA